jgi:hypothetical protein
MSISKRSPHIYEINTWVWLNSLSGQYGKTITLADVPDAELKAISKLKMDAVWLMGVWERSPAGREVALQHPDLQSEYYRALPDLKAKDVVGSPYSVRRYVVDEHLGGPEGLAAFRQRLAKEGIGLILDFVPNHVATDHPWIIEKPDALIQGTSQDLAHNPVSHYQANGHIFAHGRDPYFPAWTDTAQVNAFSPTLREAAQETLLSIAEQCDGVRCDMAMLVTNDIFKRTWNEHAGDVPQTEYWETLIPAVHEKYPAFLFIAEVYWDMEAELQQQGFDYCYDKRLYDHILNRDPRGINAHLKADIAYQDRLIRFIENHDEARANEALGDLRSRAAALLIATLPGAKLWHEGQFEGFQVKLPVQLGRRPAESGPSRDMEKFYRFLIKEMKKRTYRDGEWRQRDVIPAWPANPTHSNFIAYTWKRGDKRRLIVINFSDTRSQGRVQIPLFELENEMWELDDILNGRYFEREGNDMAVGGLYVDLAPWQAHVFKFKAAEEDE